jgi:hypothetical protein
MIPLVLITVTFGYVLACWLAPFKRCRRCAGLGRQVTGIRRKVRHCRRCRGTGLRLRAGRWIYNHLSRVRREAGR